MHPLHRHVGQYNQIGRTNHVRRGVLHVPTVQNQCAADPLQLAHEFHHTGRRGHIHRHYRIGRQLFDQIEGDLRRGPHRFRTGPLGQSFQDWLSKIFSTRTRSVSG